MQQPLSISLPTDSAQTTIPVIAEGQYVKWKLKSVQENKNDTGPFLTFTCQLAAPTVTTEGEPLTPDSPVGNMFWHKIYLYEKVSKDSKDAKRNEAGEIITPLRSINSVCAIIDAVLNTCDAKDAKGLAKGKSPRPVWSDATCNAMINQTFNAKMRVVNDSYGIKNDFGTLLSDADADMPKAT